MSFLNGSQVFLMKIHAMRCCRCSSSLFLKWDLCWGLLEFGMLHVRAIHRVPKDVLMGTNWAAAP